MSVRLSVRADIIEAKKEKSEGKTTTIK